MIRATAALTGRTRLRSRASTVRLSIARTHTSVQPRVRCRTPRHRRATPSRTNPVRANLVLWFLVLLVQGLSDGSRWIDRLLWGAGVVRADTRWDGADFWA